MKSAKVKVPWREGLHARPAANLVRIAYNFQSDVQLKVGDRTADARSILNILLLCASMGAVIDIEAIGVDEDLALSSIQEIFETDCYDHRD